MTEIVYGVQFRGDAGGLVGETQRVDRNAGKLNKTLRETETSAGRAARGANKLSAESAKLRKNMGGATAAARRLVQVAAAAAVSFGISGLVQVADTYSLINSRLSLVTDSTLQLTEAQRDLFQITQDTRISYEATVGLFTRLARSTNDLDLTYRDLLTSTTAIQQSIIVSGSTAQEAQAGLIQFAQGLQSGRLAGDELRSVLEQMPRLAQAIARGLGVTVGELRKLGEEGELTAQQVLGAIQKEAPKIAEEFEQMALTVDQSLTKVGNSLTNLAGRFDQTTGASSGLARLLSESAGGIDAAADLLFPDAISQIEELDKVIADLETRLSAEPSPLFGALIDLGLVERSTGAERLLQRFRDQRLQLELDLAGDEGGPSPARTAKDAADQKTIEKARDLNAELGRQIDQLQRLELATRLGADAINLVTDAIAAEDAVAKFKIDTESALAEEIFNRTLQVEALKRAIGELEDREEAHNDAVEEIRKGLLETRPAYEAAIEAANQWRREQLDALDETKAGYAAFARDVEIVFAQQVKDALEEAERDSNDWAVAARRALKDVAEESDNTAATVADGIKGSFENATDATVDFATTGKVSFSGLVDSIIADLLRLQFQQNLTGPLAAFLSQIDLSSLFGGGTTGGGGGMPVHAQIAHSGGIAGAGGPRRQVPASAFAGGEVPVIAREGEGIFTPHQMENADRLIQALARQSLNVTVINKAGVDVGVRERQNGSGGRDLELVLDEVNARNIGRGGATADAILSLTGSSPQMTRR